MAVTRLKLPFGKMPPKFDDSGVEQWRDYCAVTDASSNKPDEIVIIDLVLTGLTKTNAVKVTGVSVATEKDLGDFRIDPKLRTGLPRPNEKLEKG